MSASLNSAAPTAFVRATLLAGRAGGSLVSGIAAATCLLVLATIVWGGITNPMGARVPIIAAALLALALILGTVAHRRLALPEHDRAWERAGLAALWLLGLTSFAWALAFDSNQSSDFGIYYRCGTHLKSTLAEWLASCRSNYFYQPDNTYWSRALAYSAPFGLFFGDNYQAFKLYNAALHAATLALLYHGVRRLADPRAALVALLVFGFYPEWFFAVPVATPDNLALLLLVAFLLLVPLLPGTPGTRGWLVVGGLALLAFLANMARTIGPFLIVAVVLGTLVTLRRDRREGPLLRAAAVVVLYNLANVLFVAGIGSPVQGQFAFMERVSTIDLREPLQNYRLVFGWVDQFLPVVPEASRAKVAMHRIVAEFSHGFQNYPAYLLAKARVFSEGTGYYLYSSMDGGVNPDSHVTARAFTVPTHPLMVIVLGGIAVFMAALTALALLRGRRDSLTLACLFFMAMLCAVILGLGDTQQRYSLLIAPALAIICGVSFFPPRNQEAPVASVPSGQSAPARMGNVAWMLAGVAAIGLFYIVGSKVAAVVAARIPKPLAETHQEAARAGVACNQVKVPFQADYKRLRATPAPGSGCFSLLAPLPPAARSVSFFVSRDEFPFPFEPRTASPYRIRVQHGDRVLYEGELGRQTVQWHRFSLQPSPAGQPHALRFEVTPTVPDAKEPFNLWWLTPGARS